MNAELQSTVTNAPTLAAPRAVVSDTGRGSLSRTLLDATFRRMRRGHLVMELPDGGFVSYGESAGGSWHALTPNPAARAIPEVARMHVRDEAFFSRCVLYGDIGFAEAYMEGQWDSPDLSAVIAWFVLNIDSSPGLSGSSVRAGALNLLRLVNRLGHLLQPNSLRKSVSNIRRHYDLSNDFFALWLDPSMMYSSARWTSPALTLEQAQSEKNEALCRQLALDAQHHVLEIGTGWGGWALHAARTRGCRVTTLTLSASQHELATRRVREAGLSHLIEVRLQDYRELPEQGTFDRVVSIEMLEAVGHRYLEEWCGVVSRALRPDGLMALQFITCPDSRYPSFRRGVDFIQKHIFPGSLLLSLNRISSLLSKQGGFVLNRLEDFGPDYARTLREWRCRFNACTDEVAALGFDELFRRKWNYYLAYCEAAFALRNISVVHAVYTRPNNLSL